MTTNNKITHLLLPMVEGKPLPSNPITVTFQPKYSNAAGADLNDADGATHCKLIPKIDSQDDFNILKYSTDSVKVGEFAGRIGPAKDALNGGELSPLGLRGLNDDGTFSGGKKSKSKKHAKSKKQKKRKSVRRR